MSKKPALLDIAATHDTISILHVELGIFRDVSLYAALPVVLSEERALRNPTVGPPPRVRYSGSDQTLFVPGSVSKERSGLDRLVIAVRYRPWRARGIKRQSVLSVALGTDLAIGSVITACVDEVDSGTSSNAHNCSRRVGQSRGAGLSDGTHHLFLAARISRSGEHFGAYVGVRGQVGFVNGRDQNFRDHGGASPPPRARLTLGGSWQPALSVDRKRRIVIDLRGSAQVVAAGPCHYFGF